MSTIQQAAANVVFGIADQFRQNCSLKHGLPKVPILERISDETRIPENGDISRTETRTESTAMETTVKESPSPGEGAAASSQTSVWRRAAPLLLGAAAAGVPTWLLMRHNDSPQPQPVPAAQQPTQETKDGDLLQWLQSQGKHLPEGTWQTK